MRDAFCHSLVRKFQEDGEFTFLTGDLGYRALEPLKAAMNERFINAGVAEQNMVGMAAGIAWSGTRSFAYSIAPFLYARAFEQIRNDVCFHNLKVCIIGNGGGFGYGVMGPTHHALEDYGMLSSLPNMRCYVPSFDEDIPFIIEKIFSRSSPSYLRLGRGEAPPGANIPPYEAERVLLKSKKKPRTLVASIGPIVGLVWRAILEAQESDNTTLIAINEFYNGVIEDLGQLRKLVTDVEKLIIVEEHVANGGLGQTLVAQLASMGILSCKVKTLHAASQLLPAYGSQQYCREQSGLGLSDIVAAIKE